MTKIVEQLCDGLFVGLIMVKMLVCFRVLVGEVWVYIENLFGEMGYYVIFDGGLSGLFWCKICMFSFSNILILLWLLRGVYVF